MRILLPLALVVLLAVGCSNPEKVPYLGKWNGGITVLEGPNRSEWDLQGFVQIYAAGTFTAQFVGPQQEVVVRGNWKLDGKRLQMTPSDLLIDDAGGMEKRDPNKPYVPAEALNELYSKPFVLDLSEDGKTLQGLRMSLGKNEIEHQFQKDFGNVR